MFFLQIMQSIFWRKVKVKTTRYSKNVYFFLGHCNSTFCMSKGKALSAFLSSPVVACTLSAPLSYQPYVTLNYHTFHMYPFLFPSQPHPSLPCPTLLCPTLLCNIPYPALSSATLPYSAMCNLTLQCPSASSYLNALFHDTFVRDVV